MLFILNVKRRILFESGENMLVTLEVGNVCSLAKECHGGK